MKRTFLILAVAALFCACDHTENEEELTNLFFEHSSETTPTESDLITVKSMDFANASSTKVLTDWGGTLYASQMRYLKSRIFYDCNTSSQMTITLFVKIFRPDGSLMAGTNSPEGYTFSNTFTSAGQKKTGVSQELDGWGNSSQSVYSKGSYRVELWLNSDDSAKKIFANAVQLK
jgi:hypothetical protein